MKLHIRTFSTLERDYRQELAQLKEENKFLTEVKNNQSIRLFEQYFNII